MDTEDIGPVDTSTKQCTDYLMNYNAIAYFLGAQHKSMVENKSWTSYSLDDDDSTESGNIGGIIAHNSAGEGKTTQSLN